MEPVDRPLHHMKMREIFKAKGLRKACAETGKSDPANWGDSSRHIDWKELVKPVVLDFKVMQESINQRLTKKNEAGAASTPRWRLVPVEGAYSTHPACLKSCFSSSGRPLSFGRREDLFVVSPDIEFVRECPKVDVGLFSVLGRLLVHTWERPPN